MRFILCVFLMSFATFGFCQSKGVLQEGYHMPGYFQSTTSSNTQSTQPQQGSNEFEKEAINQKQAYDRCMYEFNSIRGNSFDDKFNRGTKKKECDKYYERYMQLMQMK